MKKAILQNTAIVICIVLLAYTVGLKMFSVDWWTWCLTSVLLYVLGLMRLERILELRLDKSMEYKLAALIERIVKIRIPKE